MLYTCDNEKKKPCEGKLALHPLRYNNLLFHHAFHIILHVDSSHLGQAIKLELEEQYVSFTKTSVQYVH